MRTTARKILKKIWYGGWIFLASSLIMLALLFSGIRLVLPLATDYKNTIENMASESLGYSARIERIDTDWHWFKPRLKLIGVKLHDPVSAADVFSADEIVLAMNLFASAWNLCAEIDEFTIVRTHMSLGRDSDGRFYAQGFILPLAPEKKNTNAQLTVPPFLLGRTLRVIDSVVTFSDWKIGLEYRLEAVNLAVYNAQQEHRAYLSVVLPEEIGAQLQIGLELRGDTQDWRNIKGKIYIQAEALELPAVLHKTPYRDRVKSGRLDFALWAELDSAVSKNLQGNINLREFDGSFAGIPLLADLHLPLDRLSTDFHAQISGDDLELELENLLLGKDENESPVTGLGLKTSITGPAAFASGELAVDVMRIQDVLPIIMQHPPLRAALDKAGIEDARGNILGFYGNWNMANSKRDIALVARFEEFGISGRDTMPSVSALRGTVRARNNAAIIDLDTLAAELDYPKLFRNKLTVGKLHGSVLARYANASFTLATRNLFLQTPHLVSRHWFDLRLVPTAAPYVDAYAVFEEGDLSAAREYLPAAAMSANLLSWLDGAIIAGRLASGDFELKGPMNKFPFRHNEGIFRIETDFENMEINYFDNWMHLKDARLHAKFQGATLGIAVHEGQISDIDIVGADAWITDFRNSHLIVQADVYGPLAGAVRYLRETDLRRHFDPLIDRVEAGGMQASFMRLDIPLHQGPETLWNFKTSISNGSLDLSELGLKFEQLNAGLRYGGDEGVNAEAFNAVLNGHPVTLDITTYTEDGANTADIGIEGEVALANLLPRNGFDVAAYLQGLSQMHAAIEIPLGDSAEVKRYPVIDVQVDMAGTAIGLPAPFHKEAEIAVPLSLKMTFMQEDGLAADIGYAGWFDAKLLFQSDASGLGLQRADIRLSGGKAKLPSAAGIFVSGNVDRLDIDEWLVLQPVDAVSADSPPQRIELRVRELKYLQRSVHDAVLQLTQQNRNWVVGLQSEFATGSVAIPQQELPGRTLVFDLDYFNADAISQSFHGERKQPVPADIPPFRLQAGRIILNGWDLRDVQMQVEVDAQTLNISELKINDPDVGLQGTAEWTLDKKGVHRTETSLLFNSKNVGRGLGRFGYAEIIREGGGTASFDLDWRASPLEFDLQLMQGEAKISLQDGQLLDVKPGGGRLFGLLSVQTIPRRLALDFKDIFAEGFRFDKMKGDFEFRDGNAYTSNYYIDGPAGRMDIQGRVGMVQRDYDQRIVFRPDLSSSLPIIGTLLGGTGAGLALIMADRVARLFGKQADDLARLEYTLTGGWDDSVITPVKPVRNRGKATDRQDKTGG